MSYRSGRRRVIAWSIILALALCALIWGLANGPGFHWGVSNRNNFTTVKQQGMGDGVSQIRIDWGLGDIILTQSEDSSLHILQKAEEHEDMIYFSTQQTGDTLEISSEKSVRWWDFFLGNARLSDLEIQIPKGYQGALSIDTQSGTIKVEGVKADALALAIDSGAGDIEFSGTVQSLQLTSTSGDIEVKGGIVLEQMSLQTSSGDIALGQGEIGQLTAQSTSGDMEISQLSAQQAKIATTSGDIAFSGTATHLQANSTSGEIEVGLNAQPESLSFTTTSGDIELHLPENSVFTLAFDTGSGDLRNDFAGQNTGQAAPVYTIQTSSGDCHIEK